LAIEEDLQSPDEKDTWEIEDNSKSQPLPTHVILKVKGTFDGPVERFMARIVAGDHFQILGDSYIETYAPLVSFIVVRIFLYIALVFKMFRVQLDVTTAFINRTLTEEIRVRSPSGIAGHPSRFYKLK